VLQILGAATLQLWAPDEVRTNGAKNRLVFDPAKENEQNQNGKHAKLSVAEWADKNEECNE